MRKLLFLALLLAVLCLPLVFASQQTFYYAGGTALASKEASVVSYYHADRQGSDLSTRSLPFGQLVFNPADARFDFTGKELDVGSGLHYFAARYYDTDLGRFTSSDLVPSQPPYQYVGNNPVNLVDPTGMIETQYTWTAPTSGSEAAHYVVRARIGWSDANGNLQLGPTASFTSVDPNADLVDPNGRTDPHPSDPSFWVNPPALPHGSGTVIYWMAVAAVDAENIQGPWSVMSLPYLPAYPDAVVADEDGNPLPIQTIINSLIDPDTGQLRPPTGPVDTAKSLGFTLFTDRLGYQFKNTAGDVVDREGNLLNSPDSSSDSSSLPYPNPSTNGYVNIPSNAVVGNTALLEIFDLAGRRLYEKQQHIMSDNEPIYVDYSSVNLPSGSYLYKVTCSDGSCTAGSFTTLE